MEAPTARQPDVGLTVEQWLVIRPLLPMPRRRERLDVLSGTQVATREGESSDETHEVLYGRMET
jgi:hypothetical protein